MKVVSIVGMTGSGKSEVASVFEENGFTRIRFGDVTDEEIKQRGLELNEENERYIRELLRQEQGMSAYARLNQPGIDSALEHSDVVIDGLYSWEEYIYLKGYYKENFCVVAVWASPGTRYARLTSDEYFLKIASVVAERATCRRHHVGAVAVKDKHILATGYNGAPSGAKDCLELGCLRDEMNIPSGTRHEVCRGIHAEQNVIIQAALHGVSLEGSTIYATHTPCVLCSKMLVNARIKRYVSFGKYDDNAFVDLFKEAGIEIDLKQRPSSRISYLG